MAKKEKVSAKSTIGLDDVCYALMEDDATDVYGDVQPVGGAIDVNVTTNATNIPQYADNGTFDVYSVMGDVSMTLEMSALPQAVQIDWLGFSVDANGALVKHKDAQGKFFALGFSSNTSTGKKRKFWLYRCKASIPDETAHTTEGNSATFNTRKVTIQVTPRLTDGQWQATIDENEQGVAAAIAESFLDSVYVPVPVSAGG